MKILVLNGSPTKNGNTQIMADEFIRGAQEAGHQAVRMDVGQMDIHGCHGCGYCFAHDGVCVQKDDMAAVLAEADQADMVVFAAPIYWFDISSQLKATIDRFYARAAKGFSFGKTALLLNSGSDGVYTAAVSMYKAMTAFLKLEDMGIVTVPGMKKTGDMASSEKLHEAYDLGKSLPL